MASLFDLITNLETDKNSAHSYLEVYEKLFTNDPQNILEIGIWTGGSLILWHEYFKNTKIYGIDTRTLPDHLKKYERMTTYKNNAYDHNFIKRTFSDTKFDILIDDGPHSLDSMKFTVEHYSKLLSDKGILVVEDIQDIKWGPLLLEKVPIELKNKSYILDRRNVKGRWDDILLIIDKTKPDN